MEKIIEPSGYTFKRLHFLSCSYPTSEVQSLPLRAECPPPLYCREAKLDCKVLVLPRDFDVKMKFPFLRMRVRKKEKEMTI